MKHNFKLHNSSITFCSICASQDYDTPCYGKGKYYHNIVPYDGDFKCLKCDFYFYEDDEIIDNKIVRIHYIIKDNEVYTAFKSPTTKYIESLCMYSDDEGDIKNILK